MSTQYPKDEFDRAGEDMPVGMHRPQPSKWRGVVPFLVVLVVVPLVAWGASRFLIESGTVSTQPDATVTTSESGQSSTDEAQSPADAAQSPQSAQSAGTADTPTVVETPAEQTQSEPQAAEPEQEIDKNVKIGVLNGTGTQGLAAAKAAALNEAGFPGTYAANASGWATQVSTVYYGDPELEASAREIARVLDIPNVELNATDVGNDDVVVLLR